MSDPLSVSLEALDHGPVKLSGSLPGRFLDLESDPAIGEVGEISYEIEVERKGSEILATGTVSAPIELECVRSGLFFSTILQDSAFLRDYSSEELGDTLNLSEDLREAVVLQIPTYPVSPEARSPDFKLPTLSDGTPGTNERPDGDSPWDDLDQLNL